MAGSPGGKPALRWVLATLSLSMLMPSLDTSIANTALPSLALGFNASFQAAQWIVLAYLLAVTALIVGAGRIGDILGRRRTLLSGILLFTAASVLCGCAPTLWFLIAARSLQGLGAAVMLAITMASVAGTVPGEKTGSAMGLLGAMSALGTTLGPALGGLLIAGPGWRALFLINVPLGILNFLLAYRCLPIDQRGPGADRPRFDHPGMLALALALAAYAMAMTVGRGRFGSANISLLAAAGLGAVLFIRIEAKAAFPLVRLSLFRNSALSALVSTVIMTTLVVGPFYLSRALGLKTALAGLAVSAGPLVAVMSGVPAGRMVDRFGARRMTIAGIIAMTAGCLALSCLPVISGLPGYLTPLAAITSGYALFQAANNTGIMTGIRPDKRGVISGLLSLSRNLGLITGASLMGAVFAFGSATGDFALAGPDDIAAGMRFTFGVAAMLMLLAIAITGWEHLTHRKFIWHRPFR
ncbi:MAG: MFS transporter [Fibrobacteria bacterium]